jgi:hypothetical protein
MLTSPRLDLVEQPDPARLQHRHRRREVLTRREAVHLLTAHREQVSDLSNTGKS